MEALLGSLSGTDPSAITWIFVVIILGVSFVSLVVSFVPALQRSSAGGHFAAIAPNLLATLGVLGTFVGILVGLLDFDVARIDASVPHLLAGLKIAFVTSIVGMLASILYRLLTSFAPNRRAATGVSAADIHDVLTEIRRGIASDGDASLVTQVQKLRTSVQDGNDALMREFRQFAEHMTENNQRAVIEALEAVIRDFNTQLTEQFGENFKQLNVAVGRLVEWQEQYRLQMIKLAEQLDLGAQAIERSGAALAEVKSHAEAIPEAISSLSPAMQTLLKETTRLEAQLQAVAELRTSAIEAFPIIEENLNRIGATIQDLSRETNNNFSTQTERMEQNLNSIGTSLQEMSRQTNDNFDAQTKRIEEELQKELQEALNMLGSNLATLTDKFVGDYGHLADKLTRLAEMVDRVEA